MLLLAVVDLVLLMVMDLDLVTQPVVMVEVVVVEMNKIQQALEVHQPKLQVVPELVTETLVDMDQP
jgi:hypothetical protein